MFEKKFAVASPGKKRNAVGVLKTTAPSARLSYRRQNRSVQTKRFGTSKTSCPVMLFFLCFYKILKVELESKNEQKERNKEQTLLERVWTCKACGTTHNRDHNAANNIMREGITVA